MTKEDLQEIKDLLQEVQGSPKEVLTSDEAAAYQIRQIGRAHV